MMSSSRLRASVIPRCAHVALQLPRTRPTPRHQVCTSGNLVVRWTFGQHRGWVASRSMRPLSLLQVFPVALRRSLALAEPDGLSIDAIWRGVRAELYRLTGAAVYDSGVHWWWTPVATSVYSQWTPVN
jgi:hypothetical protein